MGIAVFYENIAEGVQYCQGDMAGTLKKLKTMGMDRIYLSDQSFYQDQDLLEPLLKELDLGVEGMFTFADFAHDPHSQDYKKFIDLAKSLGAGNVLIIPGVIPTEETGDSQRLTQNMICGMGKAARYGKEQGVKVSMEDFDGLAAPFCSIRGLKQFMDAIPELFCSFDTGNFIMYHENELEALELFKDRICTVHMKDRSRTPVYAGDRPKICGDGAKEYPCPVGYGTIAMEEIIRRLKSRGYEGGYIVELMDCDPKYLPEAIEKSVRWLKAHI